MASCLSFFNKLMCKLLKALKNVFMMLMVVQQGICIINGENDFMMAFEDISYEIVVLQTLFGAAAHHFTPLLNKLEQNYCYFNVFFFFLDQNWPQGTS